jgi:clan AA aspartic protease
MGLAVLSRGGKEMETRDLGKVIVTARVENLADLFDLERGFITSDKVRRFETLDALVDTGAAMLSLPKKIIEELGLTRYQVRHVRTSSGKMDCGMYDAVRLTIQGRDCTVDVAEVPDDCPVLIGQIPLEALDFVVDPVNRKLIGNPEHGDEHMIEIL